MIWIVLLWVGNAATQGSIVRCNDGNTTAFHHNNRTDALGPDTFAVKSYRRFVKLGNGEAFFRRLLNGQFRSPAGALTKRRRRLLARLTAD